MAVIVTVGNVYAGGEVYETGEVITGLTEEQEQELVDLKVVQLAAEPKQDVEPPEKVEKPEEDEPKQEKNAPKSGTK